MVRNIGTPCSLIARARAGSFQNLGAAHPLFFDAMIVGMKAPTSAELRELTAAERLELLEAV
jgi:hypothetical protein